MGAGGVFKLSENGQSASESVTGFGRTVWIGG